MIALGAALMLCICMIPAVTRSSGKQSADNELEQLLAQIDGVQSVSAAFYYEQGDRPLGVAVVYTGDKRSETVAKIYELISALYGLPYNRIYVS